MPSEQELFADIVDAPAEARAIASTFTVEDLATHRMLELALTKLVENIGEAARLLSDESRAKAPHIPWRTIVSMRHRLAHDYGNVDLDILWSVVTVDTVELIEALTPLMTTSSREGSEED